MDVKKKKTWAKQVEYNKEHMEYLSVSTNKKDGIKQILLKAAKDHGTNMSQYALDAIKARLRAEGYID